MDAYLPKPLRPVDLRDVLRGLAAGLETPATSAPAPAFDERAALAQLDGDAELLREVAEVFIDDLPERMSAVAGAVERRDAEGLRLAAHAIKGSVAYFGAPAAVEAALALERAGSTEDLAHADEQLEALRGAVNALAEALAASFELSGDSDTALLVVD
jgi:two-component system, sensor histidine kinase and response regulator